jgi:hypothetical protein
MLKIIKKGKFKRVYTTKFFKKNSCVLILLGKEFKTPNKYTIQIDNLLHIEDPIGREIMHSLNNTCKVEDGKIVALYDLPEGTEITINYYDTNEIIFEPFIDEETKELVSTKNSPYYGIDD